MRLLAVLVGGLALGSTTSLATSEPTTSMNGSDYRLFPSRSSSDHHPDSPPLRLLHTSLSTLLPILPLLAPSPSHSLLVTLATPAFKPLLFNWLCFLQHKAQWGQPPLPVQDDEPLERDMKQKQWENQSKEVLKLLVVTSDEALARELTEEHGLVVWWLQGVDWDEEERKAKEGAEEGEEGDTVGQSRIHRLLQDDLFTTLRTMDLLLPPHPPLNKPQGMLEWGSLHYQSLMLERTLVMTALTGALVESQKVEKKQREKEEAEWWEKVVNHDWERSRLVREPFVGVKGVLLVDNDAVWYASPFLSLTLSLSARLISRHFNFNRLSSPSSHLSHPYRPSGPHPSILFSPDMSPLQRNSWGTYSMPCACFIYTRTSDADSWTANHPLNLEQGEGTEKKQKEMEYLPAEGAALAWRWTTLCHVSMLLKSLDRAHEQAKWIMASEEDDEDEDGDEDDASTQNDDEQPRRISSLVRAVAPSFQATSLGPALYLAESLHHTLPYIGHEKWMEILGDGSDWGVEELERLLEESGMGGGEGGGEEGWEDEDGDEEEDWEDEESMMEATRRRRSTRHLDPQTRLTCDDLARQTSLTSPNPHFSPSPFNSFTPSSPLPILTSPLPYDLFPPGMRFFGGGMEPGTKSCVVHANYATGVEKEKLLKGRGLWALKGGAEEGWKCDAEVLRNA